MPLFQSTVIPSHISNTKWTRTDKTDYFMPLFHSTVIPSHISNRPVRYLDAARVEDIAITVKGSRGQPVEQGDNVTLTCTWDRGNPPHTAALFDERNRRLVSHVITSGDAGQLEHVIHDVQCKDSGLIRCEAEGASVNKSIVLLVKCEHVVLYYHCLLL